MTTVKHSQRHEHLLLKTETEYIADPHRRGIEYWYDAILIDYMPIETVRQHAQENRWNERRQAFWRGVQAAWLKKKHVQLIQQRNVELSQALELRTKTFELIRPKINSDGEEVFPIQPKSWEGAVRAFVALDDMIEQKRDVILSQLEPMLADAEQSVDDQQGPSDLPFTREEMRMVAHGLLRMRRKKRRIELGIEDNDDEESENNEENEEEERGTAADEDQKAGEQKLESYVSKDR